MEPLSFAMPTTSILINNYNNARYLRECIASALDQSQPADEVIVYDDGSTDNSVEISKSFGAQIKLVEGVRTGLSPCAAQARAVYEAFSHSSGELVFLLDGDDRFHREKLAAYTTAFESKPAVVLVQAPMVLIDSNNHLLGTNYNVIKHKEDYYESTYRLRDVDFYYPTSALAFARSFLEVMLPLDFSDKIETAVDTRLGMAAPLYGKVLALSQPYADWRRHTGSHSLQSNRYRVQMNETIKRTRIFNRLCKQRHFPRINIWLNMRFYRQILRAVAPGFLYSFYYNRVSRRAGGQSQ